MSIFSVPVRRRFLWLATTCLIATIVRGAEWVPVHVEQHFVKPNEPSRLQWRMNPNFTDRALQFVIRDYTGQVIRSGRAAVGRDHGCEVEVNLKPGYYDIAFAAPEQRFGLVALPVYGGQLDRFFAIDAAMSWLVHDDPVRDALVRVLRRGGIGMSRERLRWSDISRRAGQWDWDRRGRYDTLRQSYRRHGVAVLEMFHDAPRTLGKVGKYPEDLFGVALAWRQIGQRWRSAWGALEVWNEPEIHFGDNLPSDQYVPLVKAVRYGLGCGRIAVPVVGGATSHFSKSYLDTAAANGLLDLIDALSFHTYSRALKMESQVGQYRLWLRAQGRGAMPLWITECGRPWKRGPTRPPRDQDAQSALDITMKAVEARACGIDRYFPFVYPYYEERDYNFGMMGRRATPLRGMAGYLQLVRALAHQRYLGDLQVADPAVVRARVFGAGDKAVVVLYTGKVDSPFKLDLKLPIVRVEGLDGRPLEGATSRRIPIPDGLTYVWLDRRQLGTRLRTDTRARRLAASGKRATRKDPPPIVARYQFDRKIVTPNERGYHVRSREVLARFPLRVRLFNLDAHAHEVQLKLPRDMLIVEGPPARTVVLRPHSHADVAWNVDLRPGLTNAVRTTVRIEVLTKQQPIDQLAIDVLGE